MNTYKKQYNHKYHLRNVGFLGGFLYFFGFIDNPYADKIRDTLTRSDFDALRSDWNTVGQDFNRVIKKQNLEIDACK